MARELETLVRIYGKPACVVSDNVLAREQNAVQGVRRHGIRATTGLPEALGRTRAEQFRSGAKNVKELDPNI